MCLSRIDTIEAPYCIRCGIPLEERRDVVRECFVCLQSPPSFHQARAISRYRAHPDQESDVVASILRRFKYGLNQQLSRALSEIVEDRMPLTAGDYDLIVPVPLHVRRLRWRGFNQAALIAVAVSRRLSTRLDVTNLTRVIATKPQTTNDFETRRRNVRNAFAVRHPATIAQRRILLVDDVLTTGATVNECARVLLGAGARRVDVLTLARAI